MPKRPAKDTTPQEQEEEELGTIVVTQRRPAKVAPVERPSTSKRAASRKKVKVEDEGLAKVVVDQADIAAGLQELKSDIENLTNVIERGIKIYASTLGISPQAFTDNAVFERETYRLAQEYHTTHQQSIPAEDSGDELGDEDSATEESEEMSEHADEDTVGGDVDELMASPRERK